MGFGDAADRIDCGIVVEQGAAAAVHLHVDETRHEKSAVQDAPLDAGSEFFLGHDFGNAVTVNDNSKAAANALAIENTGSCKSKCHHIVSVTFLRSRGGQDRGHGPRRLLRQNDRQFE